MNEVPPITEEREEEVVHCWMEAKNQLERLLLREWDILMLIHNSVEFPEIVEFINKLPYARKMAYITINKTCNSVKPYFQRPYFRRKTEVSIVDCISKRIMKIEKIKGCRIEDPPSNLKEMAVLLDKYLTTINPDLVVFDSLSKFIDFSSETDSQWLFKFLNYLKSRSSDSGRKFVLLYDDSTSNDTIGSLPRYNIDMIFKLEEKKMKKKIAWRG